MIFVILQQHAGDDSCNSKILRINFAENERRLQIDNHQQEKYLKTRKKISLLTSDFRRASTAPSESLTGEVLGLLR